MAIAADPSSRLGQGNYRRIARKAHLSTTHVSRALRGERGMSFVVAARVALAAGVTLDQLYRYLLTHPDFAKKVRGRRTIGDRVGRFDIRA